VFAIKGHQACSCQSSPRFFRLVFLSFSVDEDFSLEPRLEFGFDSVLSAYDRLLNGLILGILQLDTDRLERTTLQGSRPRPPFGQPLLRSCLVNSRPTARPQSISLPASKTSNGSAACSKTASVKKNACHYFPPSTCRPRVAPAIE
jgi:hypothetical protein